MFYTIVAFFSGEVIFPETSPETWEQKLCTNVALEQKNPAKSSRDCYGANPQSNCSKKNRSNDAKT
jgi:hypothetical protein